MMPVPFALALCATNTLVGEGFAPFADVFRYTAMRRLGTPWVDLDSLLFDPGKLPLCPFVASEHVRYNFPARTKGFCARAPNE